MGRRIVTFSLMLSLASCGTAAPPPPPGFPDPAAIRVPRGTGAPASAALPAILVAADGVWIDPRPAGAPREIVDLAEWEPTTPATHELAWPELAAALQEVPGSWRVVAPSDAPFEVVRRVLGSASMAQVPALALAVEGGELAYPLPAPCADAPGETCLAPRVEQSPEGWWVLAGRSERSTAGCTRPVRGAPTVAGAASDEGSWGLPLVASAGACPSARDLPGLAPVLGSVGRIAPPCSAAEVVPARDATWSAAIDALLAVRGAGFPDAGFGVGLGAAPPDCAAAIPLDQRAN